MVLGVAGIAILVVAWWYLGRSSTFVPPLGEVLAELPGFLTDSNTLTDVALSTQRVVISLAAALLLGFGAAWAIARGGLWGAVTARYVVLAFGIPSTLAALMALFVFRRSELGVYIVVAFIIFPFAASTMLEGLRALDRGLDQLADLYRLPQRARLRHVDLPQLAPFALAATRNEYAHAWRVVILAELFATSNGMGAAFARAFDRFRLVEVMLWLLVFVALLLGSEYAVLRPAERRILRWRTA